MATRLEKFNEFCATRSIYFPSAEIYANNFAGFYDYGPIGNRIRVNIINFWREEFVKRNNFLEIFGSLILPKDVFVASGHLASFDDPIASCEKCKCVYRLDSYISEVTGKEIQENLQIEDYKRLVEDNNIVCSKCKGPLTNIRRFNLMSSITVGTQSENVGYLRGETCQSIFLDFSRVYKTSRQALPIGLSQHGLVYRNEISPRNGLLREREFEQLETELFFDPDKINETPIPLDKISSYKIRLKLLNDTNEKDYKILSIIKKKVTYGNIITYALYITQTFLEELGFSRELIRFREVGESDRAFYSKQTFDCEVFSENGWIELFCVNYRTDYDLLAHSRGSKKDLSVTEDCKKIQPHVLEVCSIGLGRLFYLLLETNFEVSEINCEARNILHLQPRLAPYFVAVLPLMKKDGLSEMAREVYEGILSQNHRFDVFYDETGSIGKRYARLDEIGCNFCLTIDHITLEDHTVTLRNRDTQEQKRVSIKKLSKLLDKLYFGKKKFSKL